MYLPVSMSSLSSLGSLERLQRSRPTGSVVVGAGPRDKVAPVAPVYVNMLIQKLSLVARTPSDSRQKGPCVRANPLKPIPPSSATHSAFPIHMGSCICHAIDAITSYSVKRAHRGQVLHRWLAWWTSPVYVTQLS